MKNSTGLYIPGAAVSHPVPIVAIVFTAILWCGMIFCRSPFETRDPEDPDTSQTTYFQPVSPEIVIQNLTAAIRERNVENYIRCFGADASTRGGFIFRPEPSVANNYVNRFAEWNIMSERTYISNMFAQVPADSVGSLILSDVTEFQYADSVRTTKDYNLYVGHTNDSVEREVAGRMDITIVKGEDALWYISFWADYKTVEMPVWSVLKAEF